MITFTKFDNPSPISLFCILTISSVCRPTEVTFTFDPDIDNSNLGGAAQNEQTWKRTLGNCFLLSYIEILQRI